jgi:hypothetical protein
VRGLGAAVESRGGTGVKAIGNAARDLLSQLEAAAEREGRILTQRQERGLDTTESVKALDAIEAAARELKDARQSGTLETFDITKLTNLQTSRGNQVIGAATFGAGVDETPAQKVLREAQDKLRQSQDQLREEISQLTDVIAREQEQEKRNETIDRFTREVGAEVDRIQNISTDQRQSQIRSELGQTTVGAAILGAKGATSSANVNLLRQEGAQEALQSLPEIVGRLAINETGKVFEGDIEAFQKSFKDIIHGQGSTLKTLLESEKTAGRRAKIEETAFNTVANILISANKGNFQAQQLLKDAIAAKNAANAAPAENGTGNSFDAGILAAFKREQQGIRSMGLGSSVKPELRMGPGGRMVMANTAESGLPFGQLERIARGGKANVIGNAFLGTLGDEALERFKVDPIKTGVGFGLGSLGVGFGAKKAFEALKNRKSPKVPKGKIESTFASGETSTGKDKLKKQLSRSVQNTDKSTKATSKFSEALEKARKAVTNLLPKKPTPNPDNFFRPAQTIDITPSSVIKSEKEALRIAKGTRMIGPAGTLVPSANPPSMKTVQDAMFQRRIGSSGLGEFGDLRRLVPDTPEKKPSGSLTKPGAPKSSGALTKPGAPTKTPPTTRTNPPRVRGLAPLTPPKPGMGLAKGLGSIAGLIQVASARNEFTRLDDPEKFIDQRVDQLDPKLTLNNILAAMDPTTLVTTFGSQMQRQNDKLQAQQDQQNTDIRREAKKERTRKKAEQSIMASSSPELVADLVRRINRDGFSASRAIQSGFGNQNIDFEDKGPLRFQKALESLRSSMAVGSAAIGEAEFRGATAREALQNIGEKETVEMGPLLKSQLETLGQTQFRGVEVFKDKELEELKRVLNQASRSAEFSKENIAEQQFERLEKQLKTTNEVFSTNFDLSQLRVERETGQELNPLQFFQRARNEGSFKDIAATALENEKSNRLRNQFDPQALLALGKGEGKTKEDKVGALTLANLVRTVQRSAGTDLAGATQNSITRILEQFDKLGGQRGVQNALRTQASGGILDSETRTELQRLQEALKDRTSVLKEAAQRAGVGTVGGVGSGLDLQAKKSELDRLRLFDPTSQRIGTLQQEIKTAESDQAVAQRFGQDFAGRAKSIRETTATATALGEELIRDYGSSAANMAAAQGKSLQQIAAARAAAENEARARTASTVSAMQSGVTGQSQLLAHAGGDTRMVEMARLMQSRQAMMTQQQQALDPRRAAIQASLDPRTYANVQARSAALQSGRLSQKDRLIVQQKQAEDLRKINPQQYNEAIQRFRGDMGQVNQPTPFAQGQSQDAMDRLYLGLTENTAAIVAKNEADATMQQQQQQQEQQATATNNVTTNANIQLAVSLDQALTELTPQLVAGVKNALIKDFEQKMPEVANRLKAPPAGIQT